MRLATVLDNETNEPRPVFELPGGERIELRELFGPRRSGAAAMNELPIYFTELSKTVQFMDDVVEAVRQWASQRSEQDESQRLAANVQLANASPFCPPIPAPRTYRAFEAFASGAAHPSFSFGNAGSLVGHESPIYAPAGATQLEFGLAIGLIVGRGGRNVSAASAWKHVAGLTIVNQFVARDLEPSKRSDFGTAVGPYLVTLDALRDRIDGDGRVHLKMSARMNGAEVCRANAVEMHFAWPQMMEYASRDAELFPGDLFASGPAPCVDAIGASLKPGDVVELEIERLGILRTPIVDRPGSWRGRLAHAQTT
jgi:fumarylacetoacetate (FAA) hydrolase